MQIEDNCHSEGVYQSKSSVGDLLMQTKGESIVNLETPFGLVKWELGSRVRDLENFDLEDQLRKLPKDCSVLKFNPLTPTEESRRKVLVDFKEKTMYSSKSIFVHTGRVSVKSMKSSFNNSTGRNSSIILRLSLYRTLLEWNEMVSCAVNLSSYDHSIAVLVESLVKWCSEHSIKLGDFFSSQKQVRWDKSSFIGVMWWASKHMNDPATFNNLKKMIMFCEIMVSFVKTDVLCFDMNSTKRFIDENKNSMLIPGPIPYFLPKTPCFFVTISDIGINTTHIKGKRNPAWMNVPSELPKGCDNQYIQCTKGIPLYLFSHWIRGQTLISVQRCLSALTPKLEPIKGMTIDLKITLHAFDLFFTGSSNTAAVVTGKTNINKRKPRERIEITFDDDEEEIIHCGDDEREHRTLTKRKLTNHTNAENMTPKEAAEIILSMNDIPPCVLYTINKHHNSSTHPGHHERNSFVWTLFYWCYTRGEKNLQEEAMVIMKKAYMSLFVDDHNYPSLEASFFADCSVGVDFMKNCESCFKNMTPGRKRKKEDTFNQGHMPSTLGKNCKKMEEEGFCPLALNSSGGRTTHRGPNDIEDFGIYQIECSKKYEKQTGCGRKVNIYSPHSWFKNSVVTKIRQTSPPSAV